MSDLVIDAVAAAGVTGATRVRIELTDSRGAPVVGYVIANDSVLVSSSVFTTDEAGHLVIDVLPNAEIEPANTCYTVTVADKNFLIQKSGALQNLFEAVVEDPGPLEPVGVEFLTVANNLSDVADAATSRDNLGLGDSATLDVGTTAGTVAAGDDPRFDMSMMPHNNLIDRDVADTHPASSITFTPAGDLVATEVQAAIEEVDTELHAHETDTVDAHDASAISVVPFSTISSTDVQAALEEVFAEAVGSASATGVAFTPTGDLTSTNVQDVIVELDGELHTHETDPTDAHDASAISFVPGSGIAATNAQAAIEEAKTDSTAYTDAHIADSVDAHAASAIGFSAYSNLSSTNVQAAIQEVADEFVQNNGSYATTATDVLRTRVTGNINPRFTVNADGSQEWGDGTSTADTNLYRSSADLLKTDDTFSARRFLTTGSFNSDDTLIRIDGAHTSTAASAHSLLLAAPASSSATTDNINSIYSQVVKAASTGTTLNGRGLNIPNASIGASSTITNLFGINIDAQTTGTNNYGIAIGAASTQTLWLSSNANNTTASAGIAFGSSRDTNLYRSAADTLKTDDSLMVVGRAAISASVDSTMALSIGTGSVNHFNTSSTAIGVRVNHTNDGTGDMHAFQCLPVTNANGTVSNMVGTVALLQATSATAAITSGRGFDVFSPSLAVGATIGTLSGVRIQSQKVTGVTTAYGINQEGANDLNYFNGNVGLGTSSPTSAKLQFAAATNAAGGVLFGSDTNLYRSAADTLKTDDAFVSSSLSTGAVTATSVSATTYTGIDANEVAYSTLSPQTATNAQDAIDFLTRAATDGGELTGFLNTTDSTLSVDASGASLIFSIAPASSSYTVWTFGKRWVKTTTETVTLAKANAIYYIYFDQSGVLQSTTTSTGWTLSSQTPVAAVFYTTTGADYAILEARHGVTMDWATHDLLRKTVGAQYLTGNVLSSYSLAPVSPTDDDNTWALSSGTFADEDLNISIAAVADNSTYTTLYRNGTTEFTASGTKSVAQPFALSSGVIAYNLNTAGSYSLAQVPNNSFVNYFLFVTTSLISGYKVLLVPGQAVYGTLAEAQAESLISPFNPGGLAFSEFVMRYRITFQHKTSFTNTGQCRIEAVQEIRAAQSSLASAPPTVHNALGGRSDADAHPASSITNTAAGTISSTTVQAAINELDGDVQAHLADTSAAHAASAISVTPFGSISSTDVQAALQEIVSETTVPVASAVAFTPYDGIGSTNVQAAIQEIADEFVQNNASYAAVGTDVLRTRVTGNANPRFTLNADGSIEWGDGTSTADTNLYRSTTDLLKTDDSLSVATAFVAGPGSIDTRKLIQAKGLVPSTNTFQYGVVSQPIGSSSATGEIVGIYSEPATTAAVYTVGAAYGLQIGGGVLGAGSTMTNQYGISVAAQTLGTNNYGVAIGAASTQTLWISNNANNTTAAAGIAFGSSRDTNLYRSAADTLKTDDALTVTGALTGSTASFTGAVNVSGKLTLDSAADQLFLSNATSNYIFYRNVGVAAPAFTTRSAGTKLVLYPLVSATQVDYGIGIETNYLWQSVDQASGGKGFKWYGGTTLAATLTGTGALTLADTIEGTRLGLGTAPTSSGRIALVSGTAPGDGILFGSDVNLYRSAANILTTDDSLRSGDLIQAALSTTAGGFRHGNTGPLWIAGSGTPEAAATAPVGSMYSRTDGAANTSIYIKETGSGNTGWRAASQAASATTLTTVSHLSSTDVQDAISKMPKGLVARCVSTGSTLGTLTSTTLVKTNSNVYIASFTPDTSRAYLIVLNTTTQIATAGGSWSLKVNVGGTDLEVYAGDAATATATYNPTPTGSVLWLPTSSSTVDIAVNVVRNSASGSITLYDASGVPWQIAIMDIGAR